MKPEDSYPIPFNAKRLMRQASAWLVLAADSGNRALAEYALKNCSAMIGRAAEAIRQARVRPDVLVIRQTSQTQSRQATDRGGRFWPVREEDTESV